jgi:DNA-binding NarL/FixJ family response regulator
MLQHSFEKLNCIVVVIAQLILIFISPSISRENKLRELLAKGYSQKEISSTLHISQPTVSRNISLIKNNY